jgi:hypothetical protein
MSLYAGNADKVLNIETVLALSMKKATRVGSGCIYTQAWWNADKSARASRKKIGWFEDKGTRHWKPSQVSGDQKTQARRASIRVVGSVHLINQPVPQSKDANPRESLEVISNPGELTDQ